MLRIIIIIISAVLLFQSCKDDNPKDIRYKKGDFWISNFRNNNFPSKEFANDKIYCSSLESGYNPQFFYCLNLKTGKVDWAIPVKDWASQRPIVCDSFIYYCSYLGDLYKFDLDGNQIWNSKLNTTYGGHCLNPLNKNLIVSTVAYGLREIDFKSGKIIDSVGTGMINVPLPVFLNDTIFQAIDDTLFCKKFGSHQNIWKKKTGDNIDKLVIKNSRLYYLDNSQSLNCLNYKTGETIWKSGAIFPKPPFGPHLEFENKKVVCLLPDADKVFFINEDNGNVEKETQFKEYKNLNNLNHIIKEYMVSNNKENTYSIKINKQKILIGEGYPEEYNVHINKINVR